MLKCSRGACKKLTAGSAQEILGQQELLQSEASWKQVLAHIPDEGLQVGAP